MGAPRRTVPGLSWRGRIFNLLFGLAGRVFAPSQPRTVADFDFETARRRLQRTENLMTSAPAGMQVEPASGAPVAADWVVMPESQADRVLVFVHSGSFIFGQSRLYQSLAARICKQACATALSVDYRLAPEHPFPAAISDVPPHEWLLAEGADPAQIQFVGDSAGGIALGASACCASAASPCRRASCCWRPGPT